MPKFAPVFYARYVSTRVRCAPACERRTFFFFQAEDGIRDIGVTGVQTCALPILTRYQRGAHKQITRDEYAFLRDARSIGDGFWVDGDLHGMRDLLQRVRDQAADLPRSEERRVGKECRSRWSPYH